MADPGGVTIASRLNRILYVAAGCFLACIAAALICITLLSNSLTNFIEDDYSVATSVSQIMRGNQGTGRHLSQMILSAMGNNQASVESNYKEAIEYRESMSEGLKTLSEIDAESVDTKGVEDAIAQTTPLIAITDELHTLCVSGDSTQAWNVYQTKYSPLVTDIRTTINSILEKATKSAQARIAQKNLLSVAAYILTIAIGVIALVLIYFLVKSNARRITEPIQELESASAHMSNGKLDYIVSYESADELGRLCNNLNSSCETLSIYVNEIAKFADAINHGKLNYTSNVDFIGDFKPIGESLDQLSESLSENMSRIAASAEQVYSGAEQMSSVGVQLSKSAVEQANSVQELVSTINTVSDHVSMNAATAHEVRDSANALYNSMTEYSDLMKEVNQSMTETRNMTDKVRGIVRNLETISFQTNTLALNAAVEAARAGDAGRGFAVIADEIRELASEANRAATNTSVLLGTMIAKISSTAEQSQHAIGSLDSILSAGNTTATSVDKISNASNDQSVALEQVRQSIKGFSQSIQAISSTAEESAASAEELQNQMKLLNQMVESFEIRKNT